MATQTPGILMRLVQPKEGVQPQASALTPSPAPIADVQAAWTLTANDGEKPAYNTLYYVPDIAPLLADDSLYAADVKAHTDTLTSVAWVILALVNGRGQAAPSTITTSSQPPPAPAPKSVVVFNGSTPRADKVDDYHAWYDQEHGGKLTLVPGWQVMRRYRLAKVYGEAKTADFYGMNVYDEVNGLGGKEWQAGVTDWTLRIRSQAARPNLRRVWAVQSVV